MSPHLQRLIPGLAMAAVFVFAVVLAVMLVAS